MPAYAGGQHDSPPPSPVCSETLSLPDATSDLDMLSDCSGLSVSDEDEKRERSYTESDIEALSDNDMEEITHSMLASADFTSPRFPSGERRDQSTSTSHTQPRDEERTPSSSSMNRNNRPSPLLHRGVGARDLAYPKLFQDDLDSPFGLTSLYRTIDEERAISHDQDLQDYSVLDVQGESFRPKYERASQTETESSTVLNSTTTLLQLSHTTAKASEDEPYSPASSTGWQQAAEEDPAAPIVAPDSTSELNSEDTNSLLAQWQRCGPRWLNRQTFGIFGVVLLSVAAYHVKSAPWVNLDTSSSLNATTGNLAAQSLPLMVISTSLASKDIPPVTTKLSTETGESPTLLYLPAPPRPTEKLKLASFGPSVSALISMASSGIASLSTHVASVSSQSNEAAKDAIKESIIASRRRRPRHKDDALDVACSNKAIQVVSSQVQAPGFSSHSATALSTLPKRAQRGLSILAQRSRPCPGCKITRGTELKEKKKKQASRRTGRHWINNLHKPSETDAAEVVGNTSIEEPLTTMNMKGVNAAFSRLTAQKFWRAVPYIPIYQAKNSQDQAIQLDNGQAKDRLLLDTAQGLHSLSLGNMCKQLDSLLLPYAQQVVDGINTINYDTIWRWIQNTMSECYQIMAPYAMTIESFSKKHVKPITEEAKSAVSTSMIMMDHMYADMHTYLQKWHYSIVPLAQQYVSTAQNTVKDTKQKVETVSREAAEKFYGQSKSTVKKARRNAKKLLRKIPDEPSLSKLKNKNKKKKTRVDQKKYRK